MIFITFILVVALGYFIGKEIEKHKWVKSSKTTKFMEVDGKLYRIYELEVKVDKADDNEKR